MSALEAKPKSNEKNEDDYMSMDFILNAQSFDDNRNNKINQRRKKSQKRKLFSSKQRSSSFEPKRKKLKIRMEEQRNKGLAKPIAESNIGFKLLTKMGYKQNTKSAQKEPIQIVVRDKQSGLGIHEMRHQKKEKLNALIASQRKKNNECFKESMRQKAKHRQCIKEIEQSIIICKNLDVQSGVNLNNPIWYRPNDEGDDLNEFETFSYTECTDKLSEILSYLRETHLFCFWCGIKYTDESSMSKECPGNDKDLHDSLEDF